MRTLFGTLLIAISMAGCQDHESVKQEFTGNESIYALLPGSEYPVNGTVTLREKTDGSALILVSLKGTEGSISSYDYESTIRLQTRQRPDGINVPVDVLQPPMQNPVQYFLHCLDNSVPLEGPLSVEVSRVGQQMVDTAWRSAEKKRTLPLIT